MRPAAEQASARSARMRAHHARRAAPFLTHSSVTPLPTRAAIRSAPVATATTHAATTHATHAASWAGRLNGRESKAAAASSVSIAPRDDHLAAALASAATLYQSSRAHSDRPG